MRDAMRTRDFWLLAGSFFICGASTNGLIGTHLIPASMDHGMAEVTAASLLAVIGVFDVIGTLASGYLTDRFDSRWLLFFYYGLRGLSLLLLPYVFGSPQFALILFIVFYGLDWVATVPPTVQIARRVFGAQNFAIVYGWIFAAHQMGAATIAFAAGAVRTFFGDYQLAFMSSGLLCLVAAGLVLRIARETGWDAAELNWYSEQQQAMQADQNEVRALVWGQYEGDDYWRSVSPHYFRAFQIPLLRGRALRRGHLRVEFFLKAFGAEGLAAFPAARIAHDLAGLVVDGH